MNQYSHSRLSAYEACPKKYELAYVKRIEVAAESIEAFLGKRVHEALQYLYEQVRMTHVPTEDAVVESFHRQWDARMHGAVTFVRPELSADHYRAVGERELRSYYRRCHPFDGGLVAGLEQKVEFSLDDAGRYSFVGYVDRLMRTGDGAWEIHDYKTSTTLPSQAEIDADRQLALYHLGIERMYPDVREVTLVFHYLFFDQEFRTRRTAEQLEALRGEMMRAVDGLEAAQEYPGRIGPLCEWCEFRSLCPARAREEELEASGGREKAAALVERYMEVKEAIDRLELERDTLAKALVDCANESGKASCLTGGPWRINVWRYRAVNLPGHDDPRRRDFERLLKSSGLWERFSQLNQYAFAKAVDDGSIAGDVLSALGPYMTRSEGAKLYPKKR